MDDVTRIRQSLEAVAQAAEAIAQVATVVSGEVAESMNAAARDLRSAQRDLETTLRRVEGPAVGDLIETILRAVGGEAIHWEDMNDGDVNITLTTDQLRRLAEAAG